MAIKTLEGVAPARLARLKPEAQAMAALAHPGIVQIHGLETWRGRPLLVMEYMDGGTLAARIATGPLPAAEAVRVALALAEALGALHAAGYRHGDVKPANVGFTADGAPKLLDFGLAGLAGGHGAPDGGTVAYLSPEVLGGTPAGPEDDVWALGVVLYETIAGRRPFAGATMDELTEGIRRQHLQEPDPATRGDGADELVALLAFALGMLAAPAQARPATAAAFAAALQASVPGGWGSVVTPRRT